MADVLTDEVVANLDVLGLGVLHRIVGDLDCTLIVAQKRHFVNKYTVIP